MQEILTGQHAAKRAVPRAIRLVTWNIERGERLREAGVYLHQSDADVLALQEVDLNANRSGNLNVADVIGRVENLDYALGIAFQEMNQGKEAFQGQATLARYPISNPRMIHFREQSKFWKPRWWVPNTPPFQERLGGRIALATEIPIGNGFFALYNLHLESRGDEDLRAHQLHEVIEDANRYPNSIPVVIAGDLNTKHRTSPCIHLLQAAGFLDVIGDPKRFTTNRGGQLAHLIIDGALDWIWVRGPVKFSGGQIHTDIPKASDHWPLSVLLES
jgi:endonuclease/exonuclease/phosphatase family metal-dependent hydrolase